MSAHKRICTFELSEFSVENGFQTCHHLESWNSTQEYAKMATLCNATLMTKYETFYEKNAIFSKEKCVNRTFQSEMIANNIKVNMKISSTSFRIRKSWFSCTWKLIPCSDAFTFDSHQTEVKRNMWYFMIICSERKIKTKSSLLRLSAWKENNWQQTNESETHTGNSNKL